MHTYEIHAGTARERPTAVGQSTLDVAEIGPWLARTYEAVVAALAARGGRPTGPPFARYHRIGEGHFQVEAGFPVAGPIDGSDGVHPSTLPGGPIAITVHIGPYDRMTPAYTALTDWVRAHGGELVVTAGGTPRVSAAQLHAGRTGGQPEYNPVRGLPAGTPSENLHPPIPQTNLQRQPLAGDPWEVYFSDPAAQPDPATWRTEIVQPYRLG